MVSIFTIYYYYKKFLGCCFYSLLLYKVYYWCSYNCNSIDIVEDLIAEMCCAVCNRCWMNILHTICWYFSHVKWRPGHANILDIIVVWNWNLWDSFVFRRVWEFHLDFYALPWVQPWPQSYMFGWYIVNYFADAEFVAWGGSLWLERNCEASTVVFGHMYIVVGPVLPKFEHGLLVGMVIWREFVDKVVGLEVSWAGNESHW